MWRRGSVVGSWLVDLTADALARSPELDDFAGRVSDSGEGRWTVAAAVDEGVPAAVITAALYERFESRAKATSPTRSSRPCAPSSAATPRRRAEAGAIGGSRCSGIPMRWPEPPRCSWRNGRGPAVAAHGRFTFAVSGGHTPWAMFAALFEEDVPWEKVVLYQVDEREAPDGDADRNLTHLCQSLGSAPAEVVPMPVGDADLDAGATAYAGLLPEQFDLVHLGLGPDGHTASLVPGDPVLDEAERPVAVTGPYQGHRRMTLTYPALARADQLLWLVTGADKRVRVGTAAGRRPLDPRRSGRGTPLVDPGRCRGRWRSRFERRSTRLMSPATTSPAPAGSGP